MLYGIEKGKIENKRNARNIAYAIHVHNVDKKNRYSVFEFMPLPGDPSKAEIEEAKRKADEKEGKMIRAAYDDLIAQVIAQENKAN